MYLRITSEGRRIQLMRWLADYTALLVTIDGDGAAKIAVSNI
jgi:hypothetical protein